MNVEVSSSKNIEQQLVSVGWLQNDILRDPPVSSSLQGIRPDVALLHNAYPVAIILCQPVLPLEDLDDLAIAAMLSAEEIGVPCAYVTDGSSIFEIDTELNPTMRTNWPTPLELVARLEFDADDPRLFPLPNQPAAQLRLYQVSAVARALDVLLSSKQTALISMVTENELTNTAFQIAWKLLKAGHFKRLLFVGDAKHIITQAESAFTPFGEGVIVWQRWATGKKGGSVHLVEQDDALNTETLQQLRSLPVDYYDVIATLDVQRIDKPLDILFNHFSGALRLGLTYQAPTHIITQLFGPPVFSYTRQDALAEISLQAPEGFLTIALKEIATVLRGLSIHNLPNFSNTGSGIPVIMGKDVQSDGSIMLEGSRRIDPNTRINFSNIISSVERFLLQENDILIAEVSSRTFNRIALVTPEIVKQSVVYGSSLIRVRVDPKLANPLAVYEFFRSDVGQISLQQYASGFSSHLRLTASTIAQIKVFLPPLSEVRQQTREQLSGPANSLRQLQNEIIPDLEKLVRTQLGDSTTDNPDLILITDKLRKIADTLAPRSIGERVLEKYPTPIALAYRRFDDARFNIYEQVLRLRDLFESISFFLYNVTLADSVRSPAVLKLARTCKLHTAYDDFSTAKRIGFLGSVIQFSRWFGCGSFVTRSIAS